MSRPSSWAEVKDIATWLNAEGTKYAIHGGWAMRVWGMDRETRDVDIVIPYIQSEYENVRDALANLPGGKAAGRDVTKWMTKPVTRVVDRIVVDIMPSVCHMAFQSFERIPVIIDMSLTIPFLSGDSMFRIKEFAQHDKTRHAADYEFLRNLGYDGVYENKVIDPDSPETAKDIITRADHALVVTEDFLEGE